MPSTHPMQPIIKDPEGTARFKENKAVRHLYNYARARGCGLNELVDGPFDADDLEQLLQLIGYSIDGFIDLSYVRKESKTAVLDIVEKNQGVKRVDV